MEFKELKKRGDGAYLHRYDLYYKDARGAEQCYEMVSRRADIDSLESLREHPADAVVMTVTDRENAHLLLIHEFRMELGRHIYGLPGGLIDGGESVEECARRELMEETGLRLLSVNEVLPPAACTVGIGDERTVCVFCTAEGEPLPDITTGEEIDARWYTREELLALHKTELFGSWALAYSWMWANGRY